MLLAGLALAGAWVLLISSRPTGLPQAPTATAIVTVLPLPSVTPPGASATPQASAPAPTPGEAPPPTPSGAAIAMGSLVQVVGTGVNGLNLRGGPGLSQPVNLLALDSEVFRVDEGPREADGLVWWRVVDLRDPARGGWGAANFLQVVQGN